jgi:hypothetical protein
MWLLYPRFLNYILLGYSLQLMTADLREYRADTSSRTGKVTSSIPGNFENPTFEYLELEVQDCSIPTYCTLYPPALKVID